MKKSIKKIAGHLLFVFGNITALYLGIWAVFFKQILNCAISFVHGELTIWVVLLSIAKFFIGEAVAFLIFWMTNMTIKNCF